MKMVDIELLRKMLAEAQQGPWKTDLDVHDEELYIEADIYDHNGNISQSYNTLISVDTGVKADSEGCWERAKETKGVKTAQLITTLLNEAPAILDELVDLRKQLEQKQEDIQEAINLIQSVRIAQNFKPVSINEPLGKAVSALAPRITKEDLERALEMERKAEENLARIKAECKEFEDWCDRQDKAHEEHENRLEELRQQEMEEAMLLWDEDYKNYGE